MTENILNTVLPWIVSLASVWLGWFLSERKQKRLAELSKRMKVAQEAYTRWYWLVYKASNGLAEPTPIEEEKKWWIENCLYLDRKARGAFWDSLTAAEKYGSVAMDAMFAQQENKQEREKLKRETKRKLLKFGGIIQASTDLPRLGKKRIIDPTTGKRTAKD